MTPLDPQRWVRIRDLLEGALEQPPADRGAWLDAHAGEDLSVRADLERLIAADDRAGARLDTPLDLTPLMDDSPVAASLASGARVGTYVIDQELGRGGMGVVYRAWDTRLERWVALKALSPNLPTSLDARERLFHEARVAGRVAHESVATVYALEEIDQQLYIVSELVAGNTLRARLAGGRLPLREGTDLVLQVARGVAAAHEQGIVHRDLKPENVLITAAGRAKVVDFGIASVGGASGLTRTGVVLGTPGYMSPEQVNGQPADARSDVFAIGVMLYEVVGGKAPFGNTASWNVVAAILERDPPPLGDLVPAVPAALEHVVMTCLAKSPAARYSTAAALVAALESVNVEIAAGGAVAPAPRRVPGETATEASGRWWLRFHQVAASIALALMMVPAWKLMSRLPRLSGRVLVMSLLVLAAAIGTVRLHLWFTARHHDADLEAELARVGPVVRWGNRLFAVLLGAGGAFVADQSPELAAVCVACAAGTLAAGEIVEPSTIARALDPRRGSGSRS